MPDDPSLAEVAAAMRDTGQWGFVVDTEWRMVHATDDLRLTNSGGVELAPMPLGVHLFGPEAKAMGLRWRFGPNTVEHFRELFAGLGSLVLADTPGRARCAARARRPGAA